ncbi:hypothetical protein Hanom_Chr04g00382601 [Helianthus anomalus]
MVILYILLPYIFSKFCSHITTYLPTFYNNYIKNGHIKIYFLCSPDSYDSYKRIRVVTARQNRQHRKRCLENKKISHASKLTTSNVSQVLHDSNMFTIQAKHNRNLRKQHLDSRKFNATSTNSIDVGKGKRKLSSFSQFTFFVDQNEHAGPHISVDFQKERLANNTSNIIRSSPLSDITNGVTKGKENVSTYTNLPLKNATHQENGFQRASLRFQQKTIQIRGLIQINQLHYQASPTSMLLLITTL